MTKERWYWSYDLRCWVPHDFEAVFIRANQEENRKATDRICWEALMDLLP